MKNFLSYKLSIQDAITSLVFLGLLTASCKLAYLPLIIPMVLLFFAVHLMLIYKASLKIFLNLGLLLAIVLFATKYLPTFYPSFSPLSWPIASMAMIVMLLFDDLQLVFVISFLSSIIVSLTLKGSSWFANLGITPLELMIVYFIGSLAGAYAVRGARNRGNLIAAGLFLGLVQAVGIILVHQESAGIYLPDFLRYTIIPVFINGLSCAGFVWVTSNIFEYLFEAVSNFSLVELSDFNHPLLKRMIVEAPGTYHHSLIVSNISEAAAEAIGVNSLLCRVGAYYHDIGKLVKPDYFTENQIAIENKHDDIEPSISRLVILNHVKEGMDLAKKYNLNPIIASFIPEHHGTSLMHYFYQKALSEAAGAEDISEENYRYPGPRPQRRETAIVLLADSVEAATRSLDDPTPHRINEVVRKVINNKFIDGQLDESNLTLKEIDAIALSFVKSLTAMHHSRVKYPELKNANEYRTAKSSEETSRKSQTPNSDHSKDS